MIAKKRKNGEGIQMERIDAKMEREKIKKKRKQRGRNDFKYRAFLPKAPSSSMNVDNFTLVGYDDYFDQTLANPY